MQERTDQRERAHRGQWAEEGEYGSGQDSEKRGMDELKSSLLEIGRHVGMTTSSIAKALARLEEEEL